MRKKRGIFPLTTNEIKLFICVGFALSCRASKSGFCQELETVLTSTACEDQRDAFFNKTLTENSIRRSEININDLLPDAISITCDHEHMPILNVSDNKLSRVQDIGCVFQVVRALDLSRNAITRIDENSFSELTKLVKLFVSGNGITLIEAHSFSNLTNLTFLDLSRNALTGIEEDTLDGLMNLRYINLSSNEISFIMVGSFYGLKNLKYIDLSNNIISYLDEYTFVGAEGLLKLLLRQNQMTHPSFEYLRVFENLDTVDLSQNKYKGIEDKSFNNTNVSNIIISHTPSLRYILNSAFLNCSRLSTVDLSHNPNLFYMHAHAFQGTYSRCLDLSYSSVQYLPFQHLTNESVVILNNTNIKCDCVNRIILKSSFQTEGLSVFDCSDVNCSDCSNNTKQDCPPKIVSKFKSVYALAVGERLDLECFAVGNPWPTTRWVMEEKCEGHSLYETVTTSHILNIHVTAVTQERKYGCIASSFNKEMSKFFILKVKRIDVRVVVIARDSTSIVISWNKTHHQPHRVILHREYETTVKYHVHRLKDYWKVFKIVNLKPETPYEICIGSALDFNDRNCIKSSTTLFYKTSGIYTDYGVVLVLIIVALLSGACFITLVYKCVKKASGTYNGLSMVNSLSREYFGDVREPVLAYENHFTDIDVIEEENKTEF